MHWGLSVGNGWYSLIDTLCHRIQGHIDTPEWILKDGIYEEPPKGATRCPQVVMDQLKEKFSGCRVYYHGGDEYISGMVDLAEELSYTICEDCGRMDHTVGRNCKGWIHTSCDVHSKKEDHHTNGGEELDKIWEQVIKDEEEERKNREEFAKKYKETHGKSYYDVMFGNTTNESK